MAKKSEEEEIRAEVERVKQELISCWSGRPRPDENYSSAWTMRCCAGK
jgi:hypothetical protein